MCKWIGATKHMTFHKVALDTYKIIASRNVYLDDDGIIEIIEMDSIVVEILMRYKIKTIYIKNALHVSKLQANLLLVSKFLSNGLEVQFTKWMYYVSSTWRIDCNRSMWRQTVQNEFYQGQWSEWCQFGTIIEERQRIWDSNSSLVYLNVNIINAFQDTMNTMNLEKNHCPTFLLICEADPC